MTTIVGIQGPGWAVMAADSQVTDEDFKFISSATPKILKFDNVLIGVRGDARPGDIVAYNWTPPKIVGKDIIKWAGSKMVPSLIKVFEDNGYDYKGDADFSFLVAANGELFEIGSDLSIVKSNYGIYGVGSGKNLAIGYVAAKEITDIDSAIEAAKGGVVTASLFDIHTDLPVQIETSNG